MIKNIIEHKDLGNCRALWQEIIMKQISSVYVRLNKKNSLGKLTKLRITQGCQRAGLTDDIWNVEESLIDPKCFKNNLACMAFARAKMLGISIKTDNVLWKLHGYGVKIQDLISKTTWKVSCNKIGDLDIMYLGQLLDTKGENIITWRQLKAHRGASCKGKKAKWFSEVESVVLKVQDSREVQDQYKTADYNTQTIMLTWQNVSDDRRKRE